MGKRLSRHFVAIVAGQVLNLAGTVLLVRIFLAHWSPVLYGEWLALSSLATYLSTLDLGMNSAAGNRMLASYVKHDREDYRISQHSALAFYLVLAASATVLLGLAVTVLPVRALIGLHITNRSDAAYVMWLLSLQFLWMMPVGQLGNTYRTAADPAKTQWINNGRTLLTLLLTMVPLLMGGGVRAVAFWQLVPVALMACYVLGDLKRRHPDLLPGVRFARLSVARELLKPSLLFALILVSIGITQQVSVLVVSLALGGAAVAVFVTTRTLSNMVMQIVRTLNNAVQPDLTILHAHGEFGRLRTVHRLLVTVSSSVCVAVAAALWFEGSDVIRVWTHGKLIPEIWFVRLMLLYLVLQAPWLASSTFTVACNRHRNLSRCYIAASLGGVLVAGLLIRALGLMAVPIGLIVGEALACYHFVIKDTCAFIEEAYGPFALRMWAGFAAVFLLALVTGLAAHNSAAGPPAARWLEVGTVTALTSIGSTWLLLQAKDRELAIRRFRFVRRRQASA